MKVPSVITGFAGGGLAEWGYRQAGYTPIGAVEMDPAIAEVYAANLGPHVRVESVIDTDWSRFDRPDLLHMSPPCTRASRANANAGEAQLDIDLADAIVRALETLTPPAFVLENVVGYRKFRAFGMIVAALDRLGYMTDVQHLNSADYGTPQTRVRLYLRAVRGGLVPHLPPPVPWVGWYAAIEDLLPTLPESAFAPWQLARLAPLFGESVPSSLLVPGGNSKNDVFPVRAHDEPAITVTQTAHPRALLVPGDNASSFVTRSAEEPTPTVGSVERVGNIPRAFLVDGQANNNGEKVTVRADDEPCFTIPAHMHRHAARAWLEQGRVVSLTPRALARLMGLDDTYALPEKRALACKVLGNGCAVQVTAAIGAAMLRG